MKPLIKIMALLVIMLQSSSAIAEIYTYTNDKGRKIYVDRLSQVPSKFRKQITKRQIKVKENSDSEQAEFDIENQKLEKKLTISNNISRMKKSIENITSDVSISRNQVFVPVEVRRGSKIYTLNLLLDTGANITVIHSTALPFFNKKNKKTSYAQIANGSIIKTWDMTLQNIKFGPFDNPDHTITVIEHEGASASDGLLGMDLLAQTTYQIDFKRQKVIWDKDKLSELRHNIETLKIQLQ